MHFINEIETFLGSAQTEFQEEYVCVLLGQFSSGKTKFINHLIGSNLFPVSTREATAAPTYIRKGKDFAEAVCGDNEKITISLEDLCEIKKGACEYDRIQVSLEKLRISNRVVLIDTPGVNSINLRFNDSLLYGADVIFYFLAKSVSSIDIETIESLCSRGNAKLIFVRTRIDEIKKSEENIWETYNEERMLLRSIYPESELYFVSLTEESTELNELSNLMYYVETDLEKDISKRRSEEMGKYIDTVLRPTLEQMKTQILASAGSTKCTEELLRRSKKQLKTIEKNIKANEDKIREQIMNAKSNYLANGNRYIEKCLGRQESISCLEIQAFVISCIRKLEEWYDLELEDIVADISIGAAPKGSKRIVSERVLSQIFARYQKIRHNFTGYGILDYNEENGREIFNHASEAKDYYKKLINSVFINIDAHFSESFGDGIEEVLQDLREQYSKQDELIQQYIVPDSGAIEKIDKYLRELVDYGKKQKVENNF